MIPQDLIDHMNEQNPNVNYTNDVDAVLNDILKSKNKKFALVSKTNSGCIRNMKMFDVLGVPKRDIDRLTNGVPLRLFRSKLQSNTRLIMMPMALFLKHNDAPEAFNGRHLVVEDGMETITI